MKESVTYQAILEEGEARGEAKGEAKGKEARKILLLLGRDQFGEPSAKVRAALDALADVNRLEELTLRLKHAATWQQLLGLPGPRQRSTRRKPSS
jgi:predicted transposase YdaD